MGPTPPNRLLDLRELQEPFFRQTVAAMENLLREHPHLYLSRLGHKVFACDIDLDPERFRNLPVTYVRGDLTCLPFEDEKFDVVFCISVIEHIGRSRMIRALWELHRVLKPGRRLLPTTDFYEDHRANIVYHGPDRTFPVDWDVFDRETHSSGYNLVENSRFRACLEWGARP